MVSAKVGIDSVVSKPLKPAGSPNHPKEYLVVKLYKFSDRLVYYYEIWCDGDRITFHRGKLGDRGTVEVVNIAEGENSESVISRATALAISQGYEEVSLEDHTILTIEFSCEGDESEDLEKRYRVEDLANEVLGWTGNGHCDGGQIGGGSFEVVAYVLDPHIAGKTMIDALNSVGLLKEATISNQGRDGKANILYAGAYIGCK